MTKKIIILIIIFVILLGGYLLIKIQDNNISKIPLEGVKSELINTEQEAIDYAKQNEDIKSFAERVKNLGVKYNAYFNEELGVWQVVAYAKYAKDLDYQISFYPDGTVTFSGPIPV